MVCKCFQKNNTVSKFQQELIITIQVHLLKWPNLVGGDNFSLYRIFEIDRKKKKKISISEVINVCLIIAPSNNLAQL